MRGFIYILTFCLLGCCFPKKVHSQTDLELAEFYYNEGSFEQAKLYLVEIYKKNKTNAIYQMYYKSLLAMEDLEAAEKLIKAKIRRTHKNSQANVYVDLGSLYVTFAMNEEARSAFDKALDLLQPGRSQAVRLANAFIKLDELDLAYATYKKAQDLGTTNFHYEFANLQGMRRDFEGMVVSFLELLHTKPNYLPTVQNSLNRNLRLQSEPDNGELVRLGLLRAAKKYPEDNVYPEMLVWHFTQIKDFASAFIHARAIDLRLGGIGLGVMELGNTSAANKDLQTAVDCFSYIADKGEDTPYFYIARNEILQIRFIDLTSQIPLNIEEIELLYITIENGLPLEANLTLVALDDVNQIIDTLLSNNTILAAITNAHGIVTENRTSVIEIKNTDFEGISKIKSTAVFNTEYQTDFVRIYDNYTMDIILSAKLSKTLGE